MRDSEKRQTRTPGEWLLGFKRRFLPDREVTFRTDGRIRFVRFSGVAQICLAVVVLAAGGWAAFSTTAYFLNIKIIQTKDGEILNARLTYRSLLSEVSDYQKKFTTLTGELEKNHGKTLELVEKNSDLKQSLQTTANRLESSKEQIAQIAVKRANLKTRLGEIESEMSQLNTRNFKLKDNLTSISTDLEEALYERNQARKEGERLVGLVVGLNEKLTKLRNSEKEMLHRLADRAQENSAEMVAILSKTGVKLSMLMGKSNIASNGQGGPFIAAKPVKSPAQELEVALFELEKRLSRWEELKHTMRITPLAAPLDFFSVSSRYGKRRDPISQKWAMHYGLDFGSFYRAPVLATAPGVVTWAGRKGKYGKLVEITHGKGLKTRYGHLSKILVKRGQKVEYRKKIGLLGNTGRSTGAHLHYEIHHKGRPRNPWKFIRAGKNVYKG